MADEIAKLVAKLRQAVSENRELAQLREQLAELNRLREHEDRIASAVICELGLKNEKLKAQFAAAKATIERVRELQPEFIECQHDGNEFGLYVSHDDLQIALTVPEEPYVP